MYIKAFKTSRVELIILLAGLICFIATLWYILSSGAPGEVRRTSAEPSPPAAPLLTNARSAGDRLRFLDQFGWETDADPLDVREVVIPAVFDDAYQSYSDMQKPLGFDLAAYKGCRVKKWVYNVTNYPGHPGSVRATLLILDGRVIGGDISGGGARRFTHSLLLPRQEPAESTGMIE